MKVRAVPSRVAVLASSYAPHKGGVEELVRQLSISQREAGISTTVYTMRWPKSLPAAEVIDGTLVERYVFRTPGPSPLRLVAASALNPRTLAQFIRSLRRARAELIHVQCVSPSAWFALQASRILRIPLVVTLQGELTMDATGLYQRSATARHVLRGVLRHADHVTACSQATLREAEAWFGQSLGDRGTVIHNGVRVSDFSGASPSASAEPYIFAIGRHVPQKGFDVLLDAFARLVADPSFHHRLVIAGDGPERSALERRARDLGLDERVTFVGPTDRPRTASLFRGADVFVMPSRHEPFGIVNLEAMAAGVAVVATDVGGVSEFVRDGVSGLLVAPDDPGALARTMRTALCDAGLRSRLVQHEAEVAAGHDWSVVAAQYRSVYRDVLR